MKKLTAQDLRIGNYVSFVGKDIYKVDILYQDYCLLPVWIPIPLTEEWKEKLKDTSMFTDKQGFVIFKNEYSYSFTWNEYPYVHQLQNLFFALTGLELEIK